MCVCMYVCTYVCMHVHSYLRMYVCIHVCKEVGRCVCMYVCMYVVIYVCMYVCTYVCMYICTYEYMHVHSYLRMHVCIHVCKEVGRCVCMYVCMYVHVCVCGERGVTVPSDRPSVSKGTVASTCTWQIIMSFWWPTTFGFSRSWHFSTSERMSWSKIFIVFSTLSQCPCFLVAALKHSLGGHIVNFEADLHRGKT